MNVTGIEAVLLLLWIIPVVILYLVVRLAVRHGIRDARREHA
jgi:cytochrome c-type biogenesis protein CcmH/NrfF